jgi:polyisoprenoid-binding protein YceI
MMVDRFLSIKCVNWISQGEAYMSATTALNVCTSVWTIDPAHTVPEFKVKRMMISNVKGIFSVIAGELLLDEAYVKRSPIVASIDAAAGDPRRDAHLVRASIS